MSDVLSVAAAWDERYGIGAVSRRVVARGVELPERGRHVARGVAYRVERIGNTYVCTIAIPLRDGRKLLCRGKCNLRRAVAEMGFDAHDLAQAISDRFGTYYDDNPEQFWADLADVAPEWGHEFYEPFEMVGADLSTGDKQTDAAIKKEVSKLAPDEAKEALEELGKFASITGAASVVPGFGTVGGAIAAAVVILGPRVFKALKGKTNVWPDKIKKVLESEHSADQKALALWALWQQAAHNAVTNPSEDRRRWSRGAKERINAAQRKLLPRLSAAAKQAMLDRVRAPGVEAFVKMDIARLRGFVSRQRALLASPSKWRAMLRDHPEMKRSAVEAQLKVAADILHARRPPTLPPPPGPGRGLARIGGVAKAAAASGAVRAAVKTAGRVLATNRRALSLAAPGAVKDLKAAQYAFWLIDVAKAGGPQSAEARKLLKAAMLLSDRELMGQYGVTASQARKIRRKWRLVKTAHKEARKGKAKARIIKQRRKKVSAALVKGKTERDKKRERLRLALMARRAQAIAEQKAQAARELASRSTPPPTRDVFRYLVDIRTVEREA